MMRPTPELEDIQKVLTQLDSGIQQVEYIATGARAWVYKARYQQRDVVAKVYKPAMIAKYQKRCGESVAAFEFSRNQKFYSHPTLQSYAAEPIRYFDTGGDCVFLQEFIEGTVLQDFIQQHRYLPDEVLESGYLIVREAAKIGLYDMDIHKANVHVVACADGWKPVVCDFNMLPQHRFSPNPLLAIGFFCGWCNPNRRDYRNLKDWSDYAYKICT